MINMADLLGIFKSELRVYYLALATSVVAVGLSTIFLLFKSVATLMMMLSGGLVMTVALIVLIAAVYLDYAESRSKQRIAKPK